MGIDLNKRKWKSLSDGRRTRIYYRYCSACGKSKGYGSKASEKKCTLCRKCSLKLRGPTLTKKLESFPANVNPYDWRWKPTKRGRTRVYHMYCPTCDADRDYRDVQFAVQDCRTCMGKKMRKPLTGDYIVKTYEDGQRVVKYRDFCPICGSDKGHLSKQYLGKRCKKCADAEAVQKKQEKVSPGRRINHMYPDAEENITWKWRIRPSGKTRVVGTYCRDCDKYVGFQIFNKKRIYRCPECAEEERHRVRVSKLNDPCVDYTDWVKKIDPKTGKMYRKYQLYCSRCGAARGYNKPAKKDIICPACASTSKGNEAVATALDYLQIVYSAEHSFDGCRNKYVLRFDFYLPEYNVCIEYDGEQHFRPVAHFGGVERFKIQQKHDAIKDQYCKDNNIHLIRIPYTDFDRIEEILEELFIELAA